MQKLGKIYSDLLKSLNFMYVQRGLASVSVDECSDSLFHLCQ